MRFRRSRTLLAVALSAGLVAAGQSAMPHLSAATAVVSSDSKGSSSSRTSITIDRPAGTASGQVMVASVVANSDRPKFTAPAGWDLVRQDSVKDKLRQAVYVKVVGAAEPSAYTWKVDRSARLAGGITAFGGIDPIHPIDAAKGQTNSSSSKVKAPGVTTTVPNTRLVHLAAAASSGRLTAPSGMKEEWEAKAAGSLTSKGAVASLSQALQPAVGATGSRKASLSSKGPSIGVLLALRPVVGPDLTPPETTIESGPSGTTTASFAGFTFKASEPATFLCRFDTDAAEPCTSPRTYVNLEDGPHSFAVWAKDAAGNLDPTPATRTWTVDQNAPEDPVLVGAGDIAYCGNNNDEATAKLLDTIPGTVVALGDVAYLDATPAEFANCYDPTWGRHKARTMPVPGNHEYQDSPTAAGYFGYFGAVAGDPGKGYYDFRLGAWHVIVLNSGCVAMPGCGPDWDEQVQWLQGVLAASQADCTVALLHHPLFSSGSAHGAYPALKDFWNLLYRYGADLVLDGHEHVYERFAMQRPDGTADAVFGVRQITVGTGGRNNHSFSSVAPNSEKRATPYGVLKVTLHDQSYSWDFVPVAGQTFTDSGTAACHGAPPGTPPPPPVEEPPPDELPPPPTGAGVSLVGSTSDGSSSSRDSISLARPAGSGVGDVLVATVATNYDATITPVDSGWTVVRDDLADGAVRQAVYVRVIGPDDPTSYRWRTPDLRRIAGGLSAYSGVDPDHPIDAVAGMTNGSGTAITAPSVTTTVDGAMLVQAVSLRAEGNVTPPPGMTELWEADSPNTKSGNTRDVLSASAQALQPSAGPSGTRIATSSQAGPGIAVLLALRPA